MFEKPLTSEELSDIVCNLQEMIGKVPRLANPHSSIELMKDLNLFVYSSLLGIGLEDSERLYNVHEIASMYDSLKNQVDLIDNIKRNWERLDEAGDVFLQLTKLNNFDSSGIDGLMNSLGDLTCRISKITSRAEDLAGFLKFFYSFNKDKTEIVLSEKDKCYVHGQYYLPLFLDLKNNLWMYGSVENLRRGIPILKTD